jgi:hypothetical protein
MEPQYAYQSAPDNFMPMMAGGGLAAAAQQLQGQGRGGDSMLVHMTPGEVKGLQALAMAQGGSLTINPTTGLPEAFKLKQFLPMIIGAALAPMTAGTSLAFLGNPMTAGLLVGGLETARTGNLQKGIMAGLGAYGGAGLSAGLMGAGQAAASAATPASTLSTAPGIASTTPSIMPSAASSAVPGGITEGLRTAVAPSATSVGTPALSGFDAMKLGAQNITQPGGLKAIAANMPKYSGTAATIAGLNALNEPPKPLDVAKAHQRPYEFAWNKQEDAFNPSPTPGDTSERRYFNPTFTPLPIFQAAGGGQVNPMDEMTEDGGYAEGGQTGLGALAKKRKSLRGDPLYKFAQDRRDSSMEASVEQNFAAGGLPPRFLSGGGDGMSDSIKANIDGKQEARLADGEFVVPADVVSHLGNGSSKAGAKKLYSMMDRIRKARTGKTRQAPEVNSLKYMPA